MKENPDVYYEKLSDCKIYCEHCGHSILIFKSHPVGYIICNHCGHIVFSSQKDKQDYEEKQKKIKFKNKLRMELKKHDYRI